MCDLVISHPVSVIAAQHTWTRGCDGLHAPGPCPDRPAITEVQLVSPLFGG